MEQSATAAAAIKKAPRAVTVQGDHDHDGDGDDYDGGEDGGDDQGIKRAPLVVTVQGDYDHDGYPA